MTKVSQLGRSSLLRFSIYRVEALLSSSESHLLHSCLFIVTSLPLAAYTSSYILICDFLHIVFISVTHLRERAGAVLDSN